MQINATFNSLTKQQELELLAQIIYRMERQYLKIGLYEFKIPRKSVIYKAFAYNYLMTLPDGRRYWELSRDEQQELNNAHRASLNGYIEHILLHSSISQWLTLVLEHYTLQRANYILSGFIRNIDISVTLDEPRPLTELKENTDEPREHD